MSLRDDVRWLREAADGLLVGWLPPRLPKWATSEGEQLGWLVLLLWRKFYDASMERLAAQTEAARLAGEVDGLRRARGGFRGARRNDTHHRLLLDRRRQPTASWLLGR